MTFVYHIVFVVTVIELFLLVLLLIPFSTIIQNKLCMFMIDIRQRLKIFLIILFALIILLFIDSANTAITTNHPNKPQQNIIVDPYTHCKVFYAQRNSYLTLMAMLLGLILYRIPNIIRNNSNNNQKIKQE